MWKPRLSFPSDIELARSPLMMSSPPHDGSAPTQHRSEPFCWLVSSFQAKPGNVACCTKHARRSREIRIESKADLI